MHKKTWMFLGAAALVAATPLSASGFPLGDEPIAVPRTVKQGIDFVYVDPDLSNVAKRHQRPVNWLLRTIGLDWAVAGALGNGSADSHSLVTRCRRLWTRRPRRTRGPRRRALSVKVARVKSATGLIAGRSSVARHPSH
jgi:hypothetical protein